MPPPPRPKDEGDESGSKPNEGASGEKDQPYSTSFFSESQWFIHYTPLYTRLDAPRGDEVIDFTDYR